MVGVGWVPTPWPPGGLHWWMLREGWGLLLATRGDVDLATRGEFFMATDMGGNIRDYVGLGNGQ